MCSILGSSPKLGEKVTDNLERNFVVIKEKGDLLYVYEIKEEVPEELLEEEKKKVKEHLFLFFVKAGVAIETEVPVDIFRMSKYKKDTYPSELLIDQKTVSIWGHEFQSMGTSWTGDCLSILIKDDHITSQILVKYSSLTLESATAA